MPNPNPEAKLAKNIKASKANRRIKYCSVTHCRHSKSNACISGELPPKVHRLPDNKCVRQKWFDFLKIHNIYSENISGSYLLCDDHFDESCFSRDLKSELLYNKPKSILQTGSTPTIYLKTENKSSPEDCQTQTIDDILKEYEDKTEDFVTLATKNILRLKRNSCCIINCKSESRTSKLYSVDKFKLFHRIPKQFVDNNSSKEYICIKHFDKKYLAEVHIFRKDSDFKINFITDYDLVNDAVPTIFAESYDSNRSPTTTNCNDEIELEFDKLVANKNKTEQVQIFDLPEINTIDANIIARNKICRICFSTTKCTTNILGKFVKLKNALKFKITDFGRWFEEAFNLKVLDVPNCLNVCTECEILLESFVDFKTKALKSNKQFLEIFNNIDWMDIEFAKLNLIENKFEAERKLRKKSIEKIEFDNKVIQIDSCSENDDTNSSLSKANRKENCVLPKLLQKIEIGIDSSVIKCKTPQPIVQSISPERFSGKRLYKGRTLSKEKCPYCPRTLTSSYFLKLHIERIHLQNSVENRTCKICNKTLRAAKYLRRHMAIHSDSYQFFCEFCGKGFKVLKNLEIHKVVHSNIRKFSCNVSGCGKKFKRSSHLNQHLSYHDKSKSRKIGLTKETCNICGKEVSSSFMNVHKTSHTHNYLTVDSVTSEARFNCLKCEKNYKNMANLRRHLRSFHNMKSMFTCSKPSCKFRCRLEEKLKKHELKHFHKLEISLYTKEEINTDENEITDTFSAEGNECSNHSVDNDIDNMTFEEHIDDSIIEYTVKEEI